MSFTYSVDCENHVCLPKPNSFFLCLLYNIEYLFMSRAEFYTWPSSVINLNKISYLYLSETRIEALPPNICELSNLRAIYIAAVSQSAVSNFTTVPNCVAGMHM